jgi:hypothetical protein
MLDTIITIMRVCMMGWVGVVELFDVTACFVVWDASCYALLGGVGHLCL